MELTEVECCWLLEVLKAEEVRKDNVRRIFSDERYAEIMALLTRATSTVHIEDLRAIRL